MLVQDEDWHSVIGIVALMHSQDKRPEWGVNGGCWPDDEKKVWPKLEK